MPAYTSFISDVHKFYRAEKNSFASPDIFTLLVCLLVPNAILSQLQL